jgi:hypothetical protein
VRNDERLTIRADVIGECPDGVPHWMLKLPREDVLHFVSLRERGFALAGLEPGDDPDDLFE